MLAILLRDVIVSAGLLAIHWWLHVGVEQRAGLSVCEPISHRTNHKGEECLPEYRLQIHVVADPSPEGDNDRVDNAAAIPDRHD